ncbi:MAG: hypothetical protein WAW37_09605 [Syntrophobacteraceae bacterium]
MRKICVVPIILFLLAIWLPAVQMNFGFYKEFDDTENRELAPPPQWGSSRFSKLVEQVDAYIGDHFGFRPDLIRWNSFLRVNLLGASPIRSVIMGGDAWLFYCSEALEDGNTFTDYMGMIPLPDCELEKLKLRLEENRRRFSEKGIYYVVAIAPNKNTIYEEFLPERIRRNKSRTRLDQFVEYMAQNSDLEILDHRGVLEAARTRLPVYWETDSHWNTYGAYVAYREIFGKISRRFPDAAPMAIAGSVAVERTARGGDLAQMLFLTDVLPENNHTVFELDAAPSARIRKLLFRHDSFGDNLYPYLTKHFEKLVNVAPFAPFRFDEIFRDPPDIVLHLFTERYLTQAIHDDFFYREGS